MQFEDAILILNGPAGTSTRAGKVAVGIGLGYWIGEQEDKDGPTFYVPTHIPSGYSFSTEFYSEEICQQFLAELAPLVNWNQPIETLVKDVDYQPEQLNGIEKKFWIEDAAATAGGGRW